LKTAQHARQMGQCQKASYQVERDASAKTLRRTGLALHAVCQTPGGMGLHVSVSETTTCSMAFAVTRTKTGGGTSTVVDASTRPIGMGIHAFQVGLPAQTCNMICCSHICNHTCQFVPHDDNVLDVRFFAEALDIPQTAVADRISARGLA
jgi:hypothetical protein